MATFAPPRATPARQPFGALDGLKLRNLQSVKNRQNAITPSSAPSLKRRHASPEGSDSENVDPNIFDSLSKRKRAAFDEDVSVSKASQYSLTTVPASKPRTATHVVTPRVETLQKVTTTPASAPAAAGRSPPQSKRQGLLQPRKRFAPPSFGTKSPSLSITAALNGTLAHKKAKKVRTLEESKPKTWFFDIFEESQEQQDYKINEWTMTQSAVILDISDDETKAKEKADKGKENIDPNEVSMPVTRAMAAKAVSTKVSRKDIMTDEARSPLGDLNPAEYFAEGLDATSVVLVHDDVEEPEKKQVKEVEAITEAVVQEPLHVFSFETPSSLPSEEKLSSADIGALLMSSAPQWDTETIVAGDVDVDNEANSSGLDIWESESAKDESEGKMEESIFALQEI